MKTYKNIIEKSPLFSGIKSEELFVMLDCLGATKRKFKKGEFVFRQGDTTSCMGFVLEGFVLITRDDYWGNRTILSEILPGDLFGEAFACTETVITSVNANVVKDSVLMMLDVHRILTTCPQGCAFHGKLINNLVNALAIKNIVLSEKMAHVSQRKLRDKVLSYLSECSKKVGKNSFSIPFNRQELADYLSVDRSALSFELSKLRDEGILEFEKNRFELL